MTVSHWIVNPPSTTSVWPVIQEAASESRKADRRCDVAGLADAAQRMALGDRGHQLVEVVAADVGHGRAYEARSDRVDADAVGPDVHGERAHERVDAALGGAVARVARRADAPELAREQHERAAAAERTERRARDAQRQRQIRPSRPSICSSLVLRGSSPRSTVPAACTRPSSPPRRSTQAATQASGAPGSRRSQAKRRTPSSSSSASARRPVASTRAPWDTHSSATARPMPDEAPVTRMRRPSSTLDRAPERVALAHVAGLVAGREPGLALPRGAVRPASPARSCPASPTGCGRRRPPPPRSSASSIWPS